MSCRTGAGERELRLDFLPVRVVSGLARPDAERQSGELEVILRDGRRVVVRGDVGNDTLRRLLDLAEGGAAC